MLLEIGIGIRGRAGGAEGFVLEILEAGVGIRGGDVICQNRVNWFGGLGYEFV